MTEDDFLFYEDQKGRRKAGCLPLKEPFSFRGRINKKCGDQLPGPSRRGDASGAGDPIILDDQSLFLDSEDSCSQYSGSFPISFSVASKPSLQNRMAFPNLARITERYQISNRAEAALANAWLTDFGLITESKKTYSIDKSKLRYEQQKYCEQIHQDQAIFYEEVNGVYVHGHKDATLTTCLETGKICQ